MAHSESSTITGEWLTSELEGYISLMLELFLRQGGAKGETY